MQQTKETYLGNNKQRAEAHFRLLFIIAFIFSNSFGAIATLDSLDTSPFKQGEPLGLLAKSPINEASGIVASCTHPGFLWVHNDSGDQARVFLIDSLAQLQATFYLEGVKARDWEDIALMDRQGKPYLIVGDIGDNRGTRDDISIYIFPEPAITTKVDTIRAADILLINLKFEDGPRDAEALFYDNRDQLLYVISKRELSVGVFAVALPSNTFQLKPHHPLILERKTTLPFTFVTAADISPEGNEILIKNILNVFYWKREEGQSVAQALSQKPKALPYQPEPQGEAIAFDRWNRGYYTLSEQSLGLPAYLFFAKRVIDESAKSNGN